MKSLEIIVSGRVQGVCFRAFVLQRARELNIKGYTKNLVSGDVKVVAIGNDVALDLFIKMLKAGSSMARVDDLKITALQLTTEYTDFRITY
ncbi:MAG: acylphosphatase [Candidatus Cloacimonetes bacterium]|nr:acylphosphatase [Candidatus Cloacimonadota bacterium]